jgi:hypothetical protein
MSACSSFQNSEQLSKKELIEKQKKLLHEIRPLLKSDELPYMKCEKKGRVQSEQEGTTNLNLWKNLGPFELREKALKMDANIMSLEYAEFGKINRFFADLYKCAEVSTVKFVEIAGMCKVSEEKIFNIKYDPKELREIGEEIIKTIIRNYAIAHHFKTFHYRDIKYSYTKKEFSGKGSFFKCY